jgi:hypothetical protein
VLGLTCAAPLPENTLHAAVSELALVVQDASDILYG